MNFCWGIYGYQSVLSQYTQNIVKHHKAWRYWTFCFCQENMEPWSVSTRNCWSCSLTCENHNYWSKIWHIGEVKHDIYGKRQTTKMKLLPSVVSSLYSRIKIFVFPVNSKRHFSIFVWFISGWQEKNRKSAVIFAVCRLSWTSCLTSLLFEYSSCYGYFFKKINDLL